MRRHVLARGRLVGIGDTGNADGLSRVAIDTPDAADDLDTFTVTPDVAAAIAADQLLFADVEVTLTRAGETTPADGERTRYLAASADVARLERALADAESARDRHHLRARLLADGILDVAAGRPLDARLDGIDADNLRALAAHLDPQRPHGPAADVERVVVGEGTGRWARGPVVDVTSDYGMWLATLRLGTALDGRRVRVVVELLPAAAVDAQDGVGDEAGEGVGQSVGVEHGASVATAAAPVKSRDGGAA